MLFYCLKAGVMLNLAGSYRVFKQTGFANRADGLFGVSLLLLAAAIFGVALIQVDNPVNTLTPLLAFLPVMLFDQLGTVYFRQRLKVINKKRDCNENKTFC